MKQVIAFLEKYAEWLALGVAALFLGWIAYAYVLSPSDLAVKVGSNDEPVLPGRVDEIVHSAGARSAKTLDQAINSPRKPNPPQPQQFAANFRKEMGPERGAVARVPTKSRPDDYIAKPKDDVEKPKQEQQVAGLPTIPAPTVVGVQPGNGMVVVPPPGVPGQPPQPVDPNAVNVQKTDMRWIVFETKLSTAELAKNWQAVFGQVKDVPAEAKETGFLRVEVEREEFVDGKWQNATTLKPSALQQLKEWPKDGKFPNKESEYDYMDWAGKAQVEIVNPPFYQVLKTLAGEEWMLPSQAVQMARAKAAGTGAAATPVVDEGPFDPANPPKNRPLTQQEKQKVYLYQQEKKREEEKQKREQQKAALEAARQQRMQRTPGGGGSRGEGGGGRRSYAPLPPLAAPGAERGGGEEDIMRRRDRRPIPPAGVPERTVPSAERPPEMGEREPFHVQIPQNPNLSGPFDPTKLSQTGMVGGEGAAPVAGGPNAVPAPDFTIWVTDDSVLPGRKYRYRMKVYMKNPLFQVAGLLKKDADKDVFALASDWSAWAEVTVPPSTHFFFVKRTQRVANGEVSNVTVEVFRKEKGEWTMESFVITPGDSVGQKKNEVDFTTGATLVDLRSDIRDTRILVADETGTLSTRHLSEDLNNELYKDLQQKVMKKAPTEGGGEQPAAAATPALINPIGPNR